MGKEIERKFLVRDDSWRTQVNASAFYHQGYLANTRACSIRIRVAGEEATLTIKSATPGMSRDEYEYPVPVKQATEMLSKLCEGTAIEKTRHFVHLGELTWEIDVFTGANEGLVLAEIELAAPDQQFDKPHWTGAEVTDDRRYYNAALSEHPYRDW